MMSIDDVRNTMPVMMNHGTYMILHFSEMIRSFKEISGDKVKGFINFTQFMYADTSESTEQVIDGFSAHAMVYATAKILTGIIIALIYILTFSVSSLYHDILSPVIDGFTGALGMIVVTSIIVFLANKFKKRWTGLAVLLAAGAVCIIVLFNVFNFCFGISSIIHVLVHILDQPLRPSLMDLSTEIIGVVSNVFCLFSASYLFAGLQKAVPIVDEE